MKKILLSCVTCLLALGLVTACDDEVEDVTPEDPNAGVVEPGGDDGGGTGGGESGGAETTYKLGVLNENLYSYYYFDGSISNDRFGGGSADWDKGVSLSVETTELGTTLSWEESGTTYYLGYGLNSEDKTCVTKTTEVSYVALNEEHDSIEDPSGQYFLGAYNDFTTLSWNAVSYYDSDFIAHLYTSAQTNPTKPGSGDDEDTTTPFFEVSELEDGESYYLGFPYTSGGETSWYMFDGTTDSSGDYLQCKVFGTEDFEPVEVKVSITTDETTKEETIGLTFTDASEAENTIYAWPSSYTKDEETTQYGEITFVATSNLTSAKEGAVTEFTWDDTHGTLKVTLSNGSWYFSTYQSKSSISLTDTSKTYAASHFYTANPNYAEPEPEPVPEVVDPDLDSDETYKLGVLDTANAVYRYFNGTTHTNYGTFLTTTTEWDSAADVYITAQPNYTEDNSCTLSTVVEDELKYISFDDSSNSVTLSDTPCVVVYDETYGVFAVGHNLNTSGADRILLLNTNNSDIRAYQGTSSYLNGSYDLVEAFEGETAPSLPDVTSITVSGATTVEVDSTITLVAAIEPKGASTEVTWSSSDSTKATVNEATGEVTGVAATTGEEVVTITATSTYTNGISGSINITVIEPQEDPDNLIGTFDFSKAEFAAKQETNAVSDSDTLLADLKLAYTGNGNDLSSVANISYVYCGGDKSNGRANTLQPSAECLKLGKGSSSTGSVSITFSDASISIAKVVIVWCPYSAANLGLVVNGETQTYATTAESYTTWDAVTETVYESITETGNVLSLASAKGSTSGKNYGALIHSIKLYSAEA